MKPQCLLFDTIKLTNRKLIKGTINQQVGVRIIMGKIKERKLSEKEKKRLARMNEITKGLEEKGYRRKNQIISIAFANAMAIVLSIPFFAAFGVWFALRNGLSKWLGGVESCILLLVLLGLIAVHELIHGITWGSFAKSKLKSIEFGIQRESLTPYCTCNEPLSKSQYIIGTIMPCIILGVIPSIAGVLTNSLLLLLVGLIMIAGAGGDLTITIKMLTYHSDKKEIIIMDHPTECGFIVFER